LPDWPIILRTGKGAIPERTPPELFERACNEGWLTACQSLAGLYLQGQGVTRDPPRARAGLEKACDGGIASACSDLALMHYSADGIPRDRSKAIALLDRACHLGLGFACAQHDRLVADESDAAAAPAR
jgi:TPR repeat protein